MNVVISQPMYMPWCGLFNQIKLCDIFIHYDDVQLSRGFYNRVQVKNKDGTSFITVPLKDRRQKNFINEVVISYDQDWCAHHRTILEKSFKDAEYRTDAIELFDEIHSNSQINLAELTIKSVMVIANYFDLTQGKEFFRSSELKVNGKSSNRLFELTRKVAGSKYITGLGALNYLDHNLFEEGGIEVEYIKYKIIQYNQSFGAFNPYLTSLDAVAYLGKKAIAVMQSRTIKWREAMEIGRNNLLNDS